MLIIKTYIDYVEGKGLGLFAAENIEINQKYWERNELFDKIIPNSKLNDFNEIIVEYIKKYGVLETNDNWYLSIDNSMFTNHSNNPNTGNIFDNKGLILYSYAKKKIRVGEEILIDYREICCNSKILDFIPV